MRSCRRSRCCWLHKVGLQDKHRESGVFTFPGRVGGFVHRTAVQLLPPGSQFNPGLLTGRGVRVVAAAAQLLAAVLRAQVKHAITTGQTTQAQHKRKPLNGFSHNARGNHSLLVGLRRQYVMAGGERPLRVGQRSTLCYAVVVIELRFGAVGRLKSCFWIFLHLSPGDKQEVDASE